MKKKIIAVGPGRCGSRNLFQLYTQFPDYVQSTHDSDPWFPEEWGRIFEREEFADPHTLVLAKERLESLKRPRRQTAYSALMTPWREIGNWIEFSAYNVPFMYGMWKQDPELEFMVMHRNKDNFIASCQRLEDQGLPFFIARHGYEPWKGNKAAEAGSGHADDYFYFDYGAYWDSIIAAMNIQFEMIDKSPTFTFRLEDYKLGTYNESLLSLFEIPLTPDNLNISARWSKTFDNATKTPEVF